MLGLVIGCFLLVECFAAVEVLDSLEIIRWCSRQSIEMSHTANYAINRYNQAATIATIAPFVFVPLIVAFSVSS